MQLYEHTLIRLPVQLDPQKLAARRRSIDSVLKRCRLNPLHLHGNKESGQEVSRGSRFRRCQHYEPLTNQWRALSDSNFEHGAFPAVWLDADDGDLYVASHFVDGENIKYRVEKLHHIDAQWTVVDESGLFNVENAKQILAKSQALKVDPVRVCCGVSFKMESAE